MAPSMLITVPETVGHARSMPRRPAYSGDVETFRSSPVYAGLRGIEQA